MFKVIKLGLKKKGIVTIKYPAEPYKPFDNTKGMPVVDINKCSRKGACVKACPTNAITMTKDHLTIDLGLCIFCGACAQACPEKAITMSHDIELSVKKKENLKVVF